MILVNIDFLNIGFATIYNLCFMWIYKFLCQRESGSPGTICVHVCAPPHLITLPEYPYIINQWMNCKFLQFVWPLVKKLCSAVWNKYKSTPARDCITQTIATLSLDYRFCQAFEPSGAKQKEFTKPWLFPQKAFLLWQMVACIHLPPLLVRRKTVPTTEKIKFKPGKNPIDYLLQPVFFRRLNFMN